METQDPAEGAQRHASCFQGAVGTSDMVSRVTAFHEIRGSSPLSAGATPGAGGASTYTQLDLSSDRRSSPRTGRPPAEPSHQPAAASVCRALPSPRVDK